MAACIIIYLPCRSIKRDVLGNKNRDSSGKESVRCVIGPAYAGMF